MHGAWKATRAVPGACRGAASLVLGQPDFVTTTPNLSASGLRRPTGIATDGKVLAVADTDNNRVRIVAESTGMFYGLAMTAGDIYTVAGTGTQGFSGDGGPGIGADVDEPFGVTVDGAGNLLFADTGNGRIRMVNG